MKRRLNMNTVALIVFIAALAVAYWFLLARNFG